MREGTIENVKDCWCSFVLKLRRALKMGIYVLVGIAFAVGLAVGCARCATKESSFCRKYNEMIEKHRSTFL